MNERRNMEMDGESEGKYCKLLGIWVRRGEIGVRGENGRRIDRSRGGKRKKEKWEKQKRIG